MGIVHSFFCFRIKAVKSLYFVSVRPITNQEVSEESNLSPDFDESNFALESNLESETAEKGDVFESDSEAKKTLLLCLQLSLTLKNSQKVTL